MPSFGRAPHDWRTRKDPFGEVWEQVVVPLLQADEKGKLLATTVFECLEERFPGRYQAGQIRTLQRRMRYWRALAGPEKEVFFPQEHPPGRESQIDFTHAEELGVTIRGEAFPHLIFELVLSHSGRRWANVTFSETFEALTAGIQSAAWDIGGVTEIWRTDNLSAATHQLGHEGGRALNRRFKAFMDHYGVRSTRIRVRKSNENGVVEKAHDTIKTAMEQALIVRGSRDFESQEDYRAFLQVVVDRLNRRKQDLFALEQHLLKPLPAVAVPTYTDVRTRVRKWSCIRVLDNSYSVPSRLIGHEVTARVHADFIEVLYRGRRVEAFPRLRGKSGHRIDYRHIIHSLVAKPGAFARYRYREDLFPALTFRLAYDALCSWRGTRADIEYVRILQLAATTMESEVDTALELLLEEATPFEYGDVKALVEPAIRPVTDPVAPLVPNLLGYDELLSGACHAQFNQVTTVPSAC